jgi:S-adenosylmethionine:tRNA ribosyltransferase-isomerase
MDVSLFDYSLPAELIAQEPAEPRDASRLLVLDRGRRSWEDRQFADLGELLRPGDCLVANRSRVIPARLLGFSEVGGKPVEFLLLRPVSEGRWEALVQPGRRCRVGARVELAGGVARASIVG